MIMGSIHSEKSSCGPQIFYFWPVERLLVIIEPLRALLMELPTALVGSSDNRDAEADTGPPQSEFSHLCIDCRERLDSFHFRQARPVVAPFVRSLVRRGAGVARTEFTTN